MSQDPELLPVLTTETPLQDQLAEQVEVVNGAIKVRKTHPGLYRLIMLYAVGFVSLGINFYVFTPTFDVYGQPNWVWGASFLVLGAALACFTNCWRNLRLMRFAMATSSAYLLFFAVGTSQPFLEGTGSLQLPLVYMGLAVLMFALLFEPFINPWTARP